LERPPLAIRSSLATTASVGVEQGEQSFVDLRAAAALLPLKIFRRPFGV
jgi:hypothetical protein